MSALFYLIPAALFLGLLGLAGFLWAMRSGQFDDLEGAAHRILLDDEEDAPQPPEGGSQKTSLETQTRERSTVSR